MELRSSRGRATIAALLVSSALAGPVLGAEPATLYRFSSEPGDFIGAGQSNEYTTANSTISIQGSVSYLTVSVFTQDEFWHITLAAAPGEKLRPGVYQKAERAAFRTGRSPGLDVSGDGRGCNLVWGTFTINQIEGTTTRVRLLDATFSQQCESASAASLKGNVLYRALPLSYSFASDPGDFVGAGRRNMYKNATSTFRLTGTPSGLQFDVSGERDYWTAVIAPPAGNALVPGTYTTRRFADATHAGLDVFGDGRGCNMSSGTITIESIAVDAGDNVTALAARFSQHCENGGPALHGRIHYFN